MSEILRKTVINSSETIGEILLYILISARLIYFLHGIGINTLRKFKKCSIIKKRSW